MLIPFWSDRDDEQEKQILKNIGLGEKLMKLKQGLQTIICMKNYIEKDVVDASNFYNFWPPIYC